MFLSKIVFSPKHASVCKHGTEASRLRYFPVVFFFSILNIANCMVPFQLYFLNYKCTIYTLLYLPTCMYHACEQRTFSLNIIDNKGILTVYKLN